MKRKKKKRYWVAGALLTFLGLLVCAVMRGAGLDSEREGKE